jgi:uncharacterized protein YoxC
MQELGTILIIAEIILFLILSILGIYLIVSVKKLTRSIESIEKNIDEIQKNAAPVLENAVVVSGNVREITDSLKEQVSKVNGIVETVKDTTESIVNFEQKTQKKIEYQLDDTLNFVSAIVKGIKSFWSALSSSSKRLPRNNHYKSYSPIADTSEEDN